MEVSGAIYSWSIVMCNQTLFLWQMLWWKLPVEGDRGSICSTGKVYAWHKCEYVRIITSEYLFIVDFWWQTGLLHCWQWRSWNLGLVWKEGIQAWKERRNGQCNGQFTVPVLFEQFHSLHSLPSSTSVLQAFIKQRNYPMSVPVTQVHERGEPTEFKALFKKWEKPKLPGQVKPQGNRIGQFFCPFPMILGPVNEACLIICFYSSNCPDQIRCCHYAWKSSNCQWDWYGGWRSGRQDGELIFMNHNVLS